MYVALSIRRMGAARNLQLEGTVRDPHPNTPIKMLEKYNRTTRLTTSNPVATICTAWINTRNQ
jgi:hypothetical protein